MVGLRDYLVHLATQSKFALVTPFSTVAAMLMGVSAHVNGL